MSRILEESRNEVYVVDVETLRFVEVNRAARENLGYATDELYRMSPPDMADVDEQSIRDLMQQLMRGEISEHVLRKNHRRKDGSTYPVEVLLQSATYGLQLRRGPRRTFVSAGAGA